MNRFAALISMTFVLTAPNLASAAEFTVRQQMVDDRKAVIASVESVHELQARARIDGTITSLLVKEGDRVAAGDKIATIGDRKLAIRIQGTQAHIQSAAAELAKAKIDFGRAQTLLKSGFATQARLDDARTTLDVAARNLDSARSDQQLVVQQSSEGTVVAPGPGRVLKVPVAVGSVIMSGETVATLSQENYILRLELPERSARFLKAGDTVQVGTRGLEDEAIETLHAGSVRLVYPEIKDGRVIADVVAPELGDYFVGERTRVYVSTGQRAALVVPLNYVYRRFDVTYVRLKGGTEVVVQVGQATGGNIEVLAGLHAGDVIVTP
jgi:multidrug efflux system membrane fusion protein